MSETTDALLSAFRNDAKFNNLLMQVKKWDGCAPVNPGKENDPTILQAVQLGALTIGRERLGPLGVYTGQMCITLTNKGWELVGKAREQNINRVQED